MRITLGRLAGTACLVFALTQPIYAQEMPQRGASKAAVEQRFGTPLKKHSPVGSPPITRWDYQGYSVYFEGNIALHSVSHSEGVIRRTPAAPSKAEEQVSITYHGTVLELPSIDTEDTGITEQEAPQVAEEAPKADSNAEEEWDGSFRFDPATGRIVPTSGASKDSATEDASASTASQPPEEEASTAEAADDHASGQEERDNAPAEDEALSDISADEVDTAEETPSEESQPQEVDDDSSEPASTAEPETEESGGGGFQMNW